MLNVIWYLPHNFLKFKYLHLNSWPKNTLKILMHCMHIITVFSVQFCRTNRFLALILKCIQYTPYSILNFANPSSKRWDKTNNSSVHRNLYWLTELLSPHMHSSFIGLFDLITMLNMNSWLSNRDQCFWTQGCPPSSVGLCFLLWILFHLILFHIIFSDRHG